jgi:pyruvate,water dikinase
MTTQSERTIEWEPPGAGSWINDRSHSSPGPTPFYRRIVSTQTAPVYRGVFRQFGGAVDTIDMQFVNGALYRRLVPLVAADHDRGKLPPAPVLWLVSRLHPEFRRRNVTARRTMESQNFLDDVRRWKTTERFEWKERNLALQSVDVASLSDAELASHLRLLDERLIAGWWRHHQLHANDLGPIGDLLVHAESWRMDLTEVMGLLRGDSPATVEVERHGRAMAQALRDGGIDPATISSLDVVRTVPTASAALDEYLAEFGNRIVSDYDIEGLTLNEMPAAVCAIIRRGAEPNTGADGNDVAEARLRSQAPDGALFDELVTAAREAYGVRDDNGPLTWAWPAGLLRLAYREAGLRLATVRRLNEADQVFELDVPELAAVLDGASEPTADTVARRAQRRRWEKTLEAPAVLGPPPVTPDLGPLPADLRRLNALVIAATTMLDPDLDRAEVPLHGLGIGDVPYQGVARVAVDPAAVMAEIEPGDVLVAAWTAPSFNAVFTIAGAVVVQEGGLLCHAAVMARELGIPAVIGCVDAMTRISSGDLIEVDPTTGVVTVLEPA